MAFQQHVNSIFSQWKFPLIFVPPTKKSELSLWCETKQRGHVRTPLGQMTSLLPALATNNSSPIFSQEHTEFRSCRCFHVKFGPDVAQVASVRHRHFHTWATGTHLLKHFAVLSLNETRFLLPILRERRLPHLPAPEPKALVWASLTINQFPALQPFGLIILTLRGGSGTNKQNAHSQNNADLLSICCVPFWLAGTRQHRAQRETCPNAGRTSLLTAYPGWSSVCSSKRPS